MLLNNVNCATALGFTDSTSAATWAVNISISFAITGSLHVTTDDNGNIVGVDTSGNFAEFVPNQDANSGGHVFLNAVVNWTDPSATYAINQNGQVVQYDLLAAERYRVGADSMTVQQFMDLTILHEIGHSAGSDHPAGNADVYNTNIWNNCFK